MPRHRGGSGSETNGFGYEKLLAVLQKWKDGRVMQKKMDQERVENNVTLCILELQENGAF